MTLATHIVIAAAVAKPLAAYNPVFSFLAALASHYLSDAIPHWDYRLASLGEEENPDKKTWKADGSVFWRDFSKFAFDGFFGAGILYLFSQPFSPVELITFLSIVIGACLPDFLEGIYYTRRAELLKPISRFHNFIHSKIRLGPYPLIGIPFQAAIFLAALYFLAK